RSLLCRLCPSASLFRPREPLPASARAYPAAVAAARRYCERIDDRLDTGEGAAFLGTVGTGKTTLAMVIAAHAVRAERSVAVYARSEEHTSELQSRENLV